MDYEKLCRLVEQWNENRLDLFHLSLPTKGLEVEGVMRFYFCDDAGRVCTKCIRVSSTATTQAVIEALVDKFLPDMKMLTDPDYTLWEVHEGGEERKLDGDEKPLLVQLNWHKDDKEGRFLLKKHGMNFLPIQALKDHDRSSNIKRSNKRFSKRERKEEKSKKKPGELITVHEGVHQENIDAMGLYKQVPPTTFTRTISNPEIVMKKRREKRIESKLKDMGHGGSLKIYGEDIVPSRPYVTILVSTRDRTINILREALRKYNVRQDEWDNYQLMKVEISHENDGLRRSVSDLTMGVVSNSRQFPLDDDDCPLLLMANSSPQTQIFFSIRRRIQGSTQRIQSVDLSPAYLVSLHDNNRIHVSEGVTEVGSDSNLHLFARHNLLLPSLCNRHCVITVTDSIFTITPSAPEAVIMINERRIDRTAVVSNGDVVKLGRDHAFTLVFPLSKTTRYSTRNDDEVLDERRGGTNTSVLRKSSYLNESVEVPHIIPISIHTTQEGTWNLLVEAMSRSAESSLFVLSSSFTIFIGLHSLPDRPSICNHVINQLCTHLSQLSNDPSQPRCRLLYWLSNSSHLYHLLSYDICFSLNLSPLSSIIQSLFHSLVRKCSKEVEEVLSSFFDPGHHQSNGSLISLLDSILQNCRSSHLNADITIQVASQLFSSLNSAIFNQIVQMKITSSLGHLVSTRLAEMDRWSIGMGIELAAECLLDTCRQAANLLMAPKNDMAAMGATAYKLNSLQMRHLLSSFDPLSDEIGVGNDGLHRMVGLAERQADELNQEEGIPLSLVETNRLSGMDMVLPLDGFFLDRSFTKFEPLVSFLNELSIKGLCSNVEWNADSCGWVTSQLERVDRPVPSSIPPPPSLPLLPSPIESKSPLVKVHLNRGNGGIGLSIVAAQGVGDSRCAIYVKKVLDGTVAARDGRLSAGDELISVNEKELGGLTQEEAARELSSCGPLVRFVVRKGAANENGLISFLSSPLPSQSNMNESVSPSQSHLYTPFMSRSVNNDTNINASFQSSHVVPHKHIRSISTNDLYQDNDPNTSFSGRSITSSTISAFSALPSHYKRPTVIQPSRNCVSPSTLRSGAVSPSLLSHSSYHIPSSPHSNRKGAVSPTPLTNSISGRDSIQDVYLVDSPPLARSSPLPTSQSINSFSRSIDSSRYQRMNQLPPRQTTVDSSGLLSMGSIAQSAALVGLNRKKEGTFPVNYHPTSIRDMESEMSRMSIDANKRYGEIMGEVKTRQERTETLIDDVADYDIETPSIVGAQEVYRDPRWKRLEGESHDSSIRDGSKLAFGDKMRLFARRIGENTPPNRMTTSSAQRIIEDDH
ncbi:hypothetical protein PFISCL1PPCAC_19794 [Pristionchus fissidentatus]|uniref:Afd-1 n=1 Tax=Pristionchus fissidentatus TaxID=1538716 RepID=A0AAV5WEY2_9BILA|nr:hypothetical protein PFISCL1PPCAC_19794 [Pristionchus fissidentatus]